MSAAAANDGDRDFDHVNVRSSSQIERIHSEATASVPVDKSRERLEPNHQPDAIGGDFHPMQNFRGSSANLKVTEKFTRKGPERLLYQFTVEDPTVWETPWSGEYEFGPSQGELFEYACHEGNYGLEGILAGAREEDRQRALAASGRGGRAGGTQ